MQVIITLAGKGTRFSNEGIVEPKPSVLVGGKPAISYLIKSFSEKWKLFFVIGEHFKNTNLEKTISESSANRAYKNIYANYSQRGPIDTVLAAMPFLNLDEPVLVSYCDMTINWETKHFAEAVKDFDMAVVNYQGFHPTYLGPNSYCHVQVDAEKNEVTQLQEKKLFTDHIEKEITSAGMYYFKSGHLLKQALQEQLNQNLKYGNEFYISLAVQALLNRQLGTQQTYRVLDYRIQHFVQFGTPADIERFEYWYQCLVLKKNPTDFKFNWIEASKQPALFNPEKYKQEQQYWLRVFQKWGME